MGRAQKLKEIRKQEREIRKKKSAKKKSRIFKSALLFVLLGAIAYGGDFGYNKYLKEYVAKLRNNRNDSGSNSAEATLDKQAGEKGDEQVSSKKVGDHKYSAAPDMQIDIDKEYTASFKTNKGDFKVKFFTKDAPKTVNNFVFLARDKFFDGLVFHRIIKDFMIQGGDPNGDGTGDPGYKFEDEINSHKLVRGTLAMANSGPDTNGSQFFIVTKEATDWLDGKHTAFGEVIEGLDNVMAIEGVEVGDNDKPKEDVRIEAVTIEEK